MISKVIYVMEFKRWRLKIFPMNRLFCRIRSQPKPEGQYTIRFAGWTHPPTDLFVLEPYESSRGHETPFGQTRLKQAQA